MSIASLQPGRITIYDIAAAVGMSHATVSRALRDHPAIAAATRERVQSAARQMGYRPNLVARGLVRGSTRTIGLLINGFFIDVAMSKVLAMDKLARQSGYQMFVSNTEGDAPFALDAAHTLIGRGVDGLLIYGLSGRSGSAPLAELASLPVPTVFFDLPVPVACRQVVLDRSAGVSQAVDELVACGHREPFMLCTEASVRSRDGRVTGFTAACRRHQISSPASRLRCLTGERWNSSAVRPAVDDEEVRRSVAGLLAEHPRCTAILCNNDLIAMIVIAVLAEMGLRVPEDLSVVGFDDIAPAAYTRPALSTIAQPVEQVAAEGWRMLEEAMTRDTPVRTVSVATHLIRRASIGAVRRGRLRPS